LVASLDRIFREERGRVSGERTMNAYNDTVRDPQRLEAEAVSELQGIARFKFHEGKRWCSPGSSRALSPKHSRAAVRSALEVVGTAPRSQAKDR